MSALREAAARRLPLGLSIAALVVAVLGATPVGQAAKGLVIPPNSVGPAQLKANAVTSLKVKNGSLLAADFRRGQLPQGAVGPAGPAGTQGPAGAAGPQGAKGDKGDPATALWATMSSGGSLVSGRGVVGTMLTAAGTYRLTFDRDVSQCAFVATPRRFDTWIAVFPVADDNRAVVAGAKDYNRIIVLTAFDIAAFC